MPLRLVLLGATGFVGSAILRRLTSLDEPALVHALVRGDPARLDCPAVTAVAGALPDVPASLWFSEPHVIIHLATKQIAHDGTGFSSNVEGTERLLASLAPSARGIIYGSSLSVCGQGSQERLAEDAPVRPQTPLARSRAAAEDAILRYARAHDLGAFVLRPRFVVGREDRHTVPGLANLFRRRLTVGDGDQAMSIIDVDDYAAIIVSLARRLLTGPPVQRVLHVGYERPLRFAEVERAMRSELGLPSARFRIPVSPRVLSLLRASRLPAAAALATKLELIGLSHHVDPAALTEVLGAEVTGRDPLDALHDAIAWYRS
jgi:nucleoside-diphosphate-sugar epimerase